MQRRTLLKLGVVSAAVVAGAGALVSGFQPGVQAARLSAAGRRVFTGIARAVLDGTLPVEAVAHKQAIDGLLERIDGLIESLPEPTQAELSQLLGLLATPLGRRGLAGLAPVWDDASVVDIQQALQFMRTSSLDLRQQAYHALHDMVGGAYFSHPGTWAQLGYPGPVPV